MNIVFDLGGVLVRWTPEEFLSEGFPDPERRQRVRQDFLLHADWLALDRGTLERGEAVRRAARRTGLGADELAGFLDFVQASLVQLPSTVALLPPLAQQGHRLYALSNIPFGFLAHIQRACSFWPWFEGAVFSCEVGLLKPERAIYQHLLDRFQLRPQDTLFFDDMAANVAGAGELGIRAHRFIDAEGCARELVAAGCLPPAWRGAA